MARIRTIKPEFFTSESLARCSIPARVTFLGLLTEADDHGVVRANARVLKGALWSLEDSITAGDVEMHLDELAAAGSIRFFDADGKRWAHITHFDRDQRVNRPSSKRNPAPPWLTDTNGQVSTPDVSAHGSLTEGSPPEVEVEVEVEQGTGSSSSSGPVHHELSTAPDDDEQDQPPTPPPPPDAAAEAHARTASNDLGLHDTRRAIADGVPVGSFTAHARACAETRWAVQGDELVALARAHPDLDGHALAALVLDQELALAGAPPGAGRQPAAAPRPVCEHCTSLNHPSDACPHPFTPAELEQLRRELGESP